jgi:hypothetical protein
MKGKKGGKKKNSNQVKMVKLLSKKCVCTTFFWSFFLNTDYQQKLNGICCCSRCRTKRISIRAKKYPWSGYTRSGKRQTKGDQLANFKQGNGDYGGIAGWSDGADITNEVKISCK